MKTILKISLCLAGFYILLVMISGIITRPNKIKPVIGKLPDFIIIGHQGSPHRHPGNSLESFKETLEINPNAMLEMDVHQTKDGYIVVNHDENLMTTTDGRGQIRDLNLSQIQKLDAGYNISFDGGMSYPFRNKDYKIPEFETVLKTFNGTLMSIDIKHHTIECANRVLKLVIENNAQENVIIGSFNNLIMAHVRKKYPEMATTFSHSEVIKFFVLHKLHLTGFFKAKDDVMMIPEFSDDSKPEYLGEKENQGIRIISKRFIADAKKLNLPVFAWTINQKTNMQRLYRWNIKGIITDYPDLLNTIL